MIFRVVNAERMAKVKKLWSQCFEKEGTPFFEYYFNNYCGKDNTVVGGFDEQDTLLTMLHLNPYMLKIRGVEILTPYIVGVATDERERGKHLFGELLQVVFQMLRSQNFPFVFLMPVEEKIYTPYEFAFVDYRPKYDLIKIHGTSNLQFEKIMPTAEVLAPLYNRYVKGKNAPVRTPFQWNKLLNDVKAEQIICELIKQNDEIIGYIFIDTGGKVLEYVNLLAQENDDSPKLPFMMARCIDARAALERLNVKNCQDCSFTLLLSDDFVEDNNHLLQISVQNGILAYEGTEAEEDFSMDMATFVQLYFGVCDVLDLVEQEKIVVNNPLKLAALGRMFPKCQTYINEYF
ncbi:MAG: GNAT family N-acetyltransferase [Acidaminococcaceae bacterium]|nr:GNAT family N-acetyltransferase [Acidaminococcaceae bacterium]